MIKLWSPVIPLIGGASFESSRKLERGGMIHLVDGGERVKSGRANPRWTPTSG
jgi:hypothetical protein